MPKSDFTWNIENLRIITFGEEDIPFTEGKTSAFLTGSNISASIKQDKNDEMVIHEVTPLEDYSVFNLSFLNKKNIIEFSLNVNEIKKESLELDSIFNKIETFAKKFYNEYNFKIKRIGVITELYQSNFNYIKNNIPIINYLDEKDDFDIRLNKSCVVDEVKVNQAISFNSAERVFIKLEEPFNIPITDVKRVARLTIDVNTDIENKVINDSSTILMKLIELSKRLVKNEGFYEK